MIPQTVKKQINEIYKSFHTPRYLSADPLGCVREHTQNESKELVAFLASTLSYGRVSQIIQSIRSLLSLMKPSVSSFVLDTSYQKKKHVLRGFKHRFTTGNDMAHLCEVLKVLYNNHGSLEKVFHTNLFSPTHATLQTAMSDSCEYMRTCAQQIENKAENRPLHFLIPADCQTSACKRMNMFLRWMIREDDGIDLGLWHSIKPDRLIMPVDTHIRQVAQELLLTKRKSADWKMALEVTANLALIDPRDPIKYDFSLCRYGMEQNSR